jgi:SnoaL-like domain
MKSKLLFIVIIATIYSCRSGSNVQSKKEELKNVWIAYYDALAKKDIQKLKTLTTGNFVMYDEGVIYNNETAVKAIEGMGAFTASFKFDSLNVHIDKVNASAYCIREAIFTINDTTHPPVRFLESATFSKVDGDWKLRFLHSSILK